jgi:hypothetical protein
MVAPLRQQAADTKPASSPWWRRQANRRMKKTSKEVPVNHGFFDKVIE